MSPAAAKKLSVNTGQFVYSLCLVGAVLGCQDMDHREKLDNVNWEEYSDAAKNAYLESGKKCLVLVYAELDPESYQALNTLDSKDLATLSGGDKYATLILKYDDWKNPDIRSIWKEVGHTKKPFIVLYSQNSPTIAFDPFSLNPLRKDVKKP